MTHCCLRRKRKGAKMQWTPPPTPERHRRRSVTPLQGPALDRLYTAAVSRRRKKLEDYEAHMKEIVTKVTEVKPAAVRHKQSALVSKELYYFPVALKQQHLSTTIHSMNEELVRAANPKGKLDAETQENMATRLCNESLKAKATALEALQKQASAWPQEPAVVLHGVHGGRKPYKHDAMERSVYKIVKSNAERKLTTEERRNLASRLCNSSLEHRATELQELESKYLFPQLASKKLSSSELRQMSDRLWKGER